MRCQLFYAKSKGSQNFPNISRYAFILGEILTKIPPFYLNLCGKNFPLDFLLSTPFALHKELKARPSTPIQCFTELIFEFYS